MTSVTLACCATSKLGARHARHKISFASFMKNLLGVFLLFGDEAESTQARRPAFSDS
jgi:hypothetical protein